MPLEPDPRAIARAAERRYRRRKRLAATLVPLALTPRQRAGLERLGLVAKGETDRDALAAAAGRVLDAAEGLALAGAALYPGPDAAALRALADHYGAALRPSDAR